MDSLNEQLDTIKNTFQEIKDAIIDQGVEVDDCDSPTVYPTKIREIQGSGGGGTIITDGATRLTVMAFKAAAETPSTPTGGSWNVEEETITPPIDPNTGSAWSFGNQSLSGNVYASQAIFNNDNTFYMEWTAPFKVTGPQGVRGEKGDKGDKGDNGETKITERLIQVYTISETSPIKPVGGYFNFETGELTPPSGWSKSEPTTDGIVWMCWGRFSIENPGNPTWGNPIRLTGYQGRNGTDGNNIEFIFKLTEKHFFVPATPTESLNQTGFTPKGWTPSPTGISPTMQCEWVCSRTLVENRWSNWSTPAIWSKWGENGTDGDGVEYIYYLSTDGSAPNNPTPEDYATNDEYQQDDWYPQLTNWSDDPHGVSEIEAFEFVSVRKYKGKEKLWGPFSNPVVWSNFGKSAVSIVEMYCESETEPSVEANNNNPGSHWSRTINQYAETTVWFIYAYLNYRGELATEDDYPNLPFSGWQGPFIKIGRNGTDGTAPSWTTTVFTKTEYTPNPPAVGVSPDAPGTSLNSNGDTVQWVLLPTEQSNNWWRCSGTVNGTTKLVEKWGTPCPDNGKNGESLGGKVYERRYNIGTDPLNPPSYINYLRNPGDDWVLPNSDKCINEYIPAANRGDAILFYIEALIDGNDNLEGTWSYPMRVNGQQGPQGQVGPIGEPGAVGPQGVSGIPGASIYVRYSLGTQDQYDGSEEWQEQNNLNPSGWSVEVPDSSKDDGKNYIWCIQGQKVYYSTDDEGTITWSKPFRLTGDNGLPGSDGRPGQIIYPAGIYDSSKTYICDAHSSPYVYDPNYGAYYVLNASSFEGPANEGSPGDYSTGADAAWIKFEMLEAVFAKVGVISNGLIGSAVFNGDYMFSQQGISSKNNTVNGVDKGFGGFNPSECEGDNFDGLTTFKPNLLFNYKTGAAYLAKGNIQFFGDGSGKIGDFLSWDENGAITNLQNKTYIINKTTTNNLVSVPEKSADIYVTNGLDPNVADLLYWKNITINFSSIEYDSLTEEEKKQEILGNYNIYNLTAIPLKVTAYGSGEGDYGTFIFPISYYVDGKFNRTIKASQAFVSPGGCLSLTAVNTTAVSTKWIYDNSSYGEKIMLLATKNVTPYFNYRHYRTNVDKVITAISNNGTSIKAWEKITFPTSHPYDPSGSQDDPVNGYLGICSIKPGSVDGILIIPDADDITYKDNPANVKYTVKVWNNSYTDDYYRPMFRYSTDSTSYMGSPLLSIDFIADVGSDQLYLDLSSLETNVKYNWSVNITNIGPATRKTSLFDSSVAFKVYFYKDGQIVGEYHTGLIGI